MFLQEKLAAWYADQSKATALNRILRDPVLVEAIQLVRAQEDERVLNEDIAASITIERRHISARGGARLLRQLEDLTRPIEQLQVQEAEPYSHIDESYLTTHHEHSSR